MEPRTRKRRRIGPLLLVVVILTAALVVTYRLWEDRPNREHIQADFGGFSKPVFYEGKLLKPGASGGGDSLALPLPVIQGYLDPYIRYESDSQSVIVTTADRVLRMKTRELTALVNEKPVTLRFPVEENGGQVYVPVQVLQDYYHFQLSESSETGAVILKKAGDAVQWAKVPALAKHPDRTTALRSRPSIKAPIYRDLAQAERLMLWGEENGWYRAQTERGVVGYVRKSELILDQLQTLPVPPPKESFDPGKPLGQKINLTWQQGSGNPNLSSIQEMPGLNVFSPQWLHLLDGEGNVTTKANLEVTTWAHNRGYRVWALFNNGFDPDRTTAALALYDTRRKMIKQLVAYAQMYQIQGINVDFENVYLKDKANFVKLGAKKRSRLQTPPALAPQISVKSPFHNIKPLIKGNQHFPNLLLLLQLGKQDDELCRQLCRQLCTAQFSLQLLQAPRLLPALKQTEQVCAAMRHIGNDTELASQ
jgi:hypothetical protein